MRFPLYELLVLTTATGTANADLAGDIVKAIQNAGTCAGCHALLLPLRLLARFGDKPFVGTITAVCKAFEVVDPDVCEGAIKLQGPILARDLKSINPFGQTATKFCDALFGMCQPPPVNRYSVPFPKPAPPQTSKPVITARKPPFHVVHFSDIHIDRKYTPGADAACSKPICCRPYVDKKGPVISAAGPMGSHNCDTPAELARNLLQAISANNKFSIFTGDVAEAAVWLSNQRETIEGMDAFNEEMTSILGAPVFPVVGNHESAPTNSFPRNTTTASSAQWVFDTLGRGWQPFINQTAASQVRSQSGSYSVIAPGTNLRIISLNTVYWYKNNFWLYDSDRFQPDPNGILGFLVNELQAAEDAGQKAWIIGHMHPGASDAVYDQSNYFDQVVQRYKDTISGQFYGHSHQDQFILGYSDYNAQTVDNAVTVGLIAPAITPRGGNPAFKVYSVDPDTYEIMDSRVYRADVSKSSFQTGPAWELYYSARDVYGSLIGGWPADEPLTPKFWHRVTEAFETNDAAFQTYLNFRRGGFGNPTCDAACKESTLCGMRALRAENNCIVSKPGLNFRRRDGEIQEGDDHGHAALESEACEGTDIARILTNLFGTLESEADFSELEAMIRESLPEEALVEGLSLLDDGESFPGDFSF